MHTKLNKYLLTMKKISKMKKNAAQQSLHFIGALFWFSMATDTGT